MPTRNLVLMNLVDSVIQQTPALKQVGTSVKETIHNAILSGGKPARDIADLLHGTWLGHPLHSVLTDVTVGAWVFSAVFDVLAVASGRRSMEDAADTMTTIGVASAVPTALAGITDYSGIKEDAVAYGAAHGILNTIALTCYVLSVRARRADKREEGMVFSFLGLAIATLSAWLGGELVYSHNVGVDHSEEPSEPTRWTTVLADEDLGYEEPHRVEWNDQPILLYRREGNVYAIGAVCSHAGGPLEQGKFEGNCVQCPWHDSVYDLRNGSLVHGPSTYDQPRYEARAVNGEIQIRIYSE